MTEEIIKECEFYLPFSEDCNEILDDNGNEIYKCSQRQDCYYKQLKRLEQERDELKKTVENQKLEYEELQCDLSEVENACGCYQSENTELKQENKELKDNNNHLQAIIDDGRAENKRFREENKELKEMLSKEPKAMQAFQIAYSSNKKENEVLWGMVKDYKTALEEIREIAEHCKEQDVCALCEYCNECALPDEFGIVYDNNKLLIDKINEVLNEKEL